MNPQCTKCKRSHSTGDETLLTCCYCSMSWHNVCHVPRVSIIELMELIYLNRHGEEIDFTRCGWSCGNCKALIKTSNPEQSASSLKGPTITRQNSHLLSNSGNDRSRQPKQTTRKGSARGQWRIDLDESSDYDDIETIDPLLGRTNQTARKSTISDFWYTDDEFSDGDEIDTVYFASNLTEGMARKGKGKGKGKAVTPGPWSTNELRGISGRRDIESSSKQPNSSTSSRPKQTARKSSTSDPWYTEDDDEFSMAEIEAIAYSARYDYPRSPDASTFDSYDALFTLTKAFESQSISSNPSDYSPGRKRQTARKASTSVRSPHSWHPTSVSTQNNSLPMDASVRDQRTIQKGHVQNQNTQNTSVSGDRARAQGFNRSDPLPLHHGPPARMDPPQSNPFSNNSSREFGRFFPDTPGHAQAASRKKQTARKATNYNSRLAKDRNTIAPAHTISSHYTRSVQTTGDVGAHNPWGSNYYNTTVEAQTLNSPVTRPIQTSRKPTTSNPWLKNTYIGNQPRASVPFTDARTGWTSTQRPSVIEVETRGIRNVANPVHNTNGNYDGSIAWWVNAREMAMSATSNSGSHVSGQRKKGRRKKGQARHIGGQEMGDSGFTFVAQNWTSKRT